MTVVLINPNSTAGMTAAMVAAARAAAPALVFDGWTSTEGPPAIQGAADGEAATPPLLDLVRRADAEGAAGIVVGCFDDTALARSAGLARCPVIGIGQAAFHHCALRQWRFGVVTTLAVSVPIIEANIAAYGLQGHLARVRASEVPVLDLETAPQAAAARIRREAEAAAAEDGIDALVLGCAGMVHVAAEVQRALSIPVIDPVVAAAGCMSWLAATGPLAVPRI